MEIQAGMPASTQVFETERLRTPFWDIVLRYWVFFAHRVLIFKDQWSNIQCRNGGPGT
jgi:hypothetical protein